MDDKDEIVRMKYIKIPVRNCSGCILKPEMMEDHRGKLKCLR